MKGERSSIRDNDNQLSRRKVLKSGVMASAIGLSSIMATGSVAAQPTADDLLRAASVDDVYNNITNSSITGQSAQGTVRTDTQLDFPLVDNSYAELSSGPGDTGGPTGTAPDGGTAYDVFELNATINVPLTANTLGFAYRFGTSESISTSTFRDFFTAEVDGTNIARLPNEDFVNVPNVNNTVGYEGTGFEYDSVSPLLVAETDVSGSRGGSIDLTFTIADVGDRVVDSGAIIDSLTFGLTNIITAYGQEIGPSLDCDGDGLFEDVNGDGLIDARDQQALNLILSSHTRAKRLGLDPGESDGVVQRLTPAQEQAFDFNDDGTFDSRDVIALGRQIGRGTACDGPDQT